MDKVKYQSNSNYCSASTRYVDKRPTPWNWLWDFTICAIGKEQEGSYNRRNLQNRTQKSDIWLDTLPDILYHILSDTSSGRLSGIYFLPFYRGFYWQFFWHPIWHLTPPTCILSESIGRIFRHFTWNLSDLASLASNWHGHRARRQ